MSVSVVHVLHTGHVVGAISGTGLGAETELTDLVGPQALVMHLQTEVHTEVEIPLPVALLGHATIPGEPGPIIDPMSRQHSVTSIGDHLLTTLDPWGTDPPSVTLTNTELTVELAKNVAADTALLVVVSGGAAPLTSTLVEGTSSIGLPTKATDGFHHVLLLVAGRFGWLGDVTVP